MQSLLLDYAAELKASAQKGKSGSYMATAKQLEDKLARLKDIYLDGIIDNTFKDADKLMRVKAEEMGLKAVK